MCSQKTLTSRKIPGAADPAGAAGLESVLSQPPIEAKWSYFQETMKTYMIQKAKALKIYLKDILKCFPSWRTSLVELFRITKKHTIPMPRQQFISIKK